MPVPLSMLRLLLPVAYVSLDDHIQKLMHGGQDILAWGADSEISLKKALFELRETLARAKCLVARVSAALHTYPVGWPACHPSIDLFFS